jgi:hypothetical protein
VARFIPRTIARIRRYAVGDVPASSAYNLGFASNSSRHDSEQK